MDAVTLWDLIPMNALLPLLLLAAPLEPTVSHRFIHRLAGAPGGEIELRWTGNRYTYLSRHYFRRGKSSEESFEAGRSDEPAWASLSLLAPHLAGCWPVAAEVTRERGEACVTQAGAKVTGTLLRQPFTARYTRGQLEQLTFGNSDFARSDQPVEFSDPFGAGFELTSEGTTLGLAPPLKGTRPAAPEGAGTDADCVGAARAWISAHGPRWER